MPRDSPGWRDARYGTVALVVKPCTGGTYREGKASLVGLERGFWKTVDRSEGFLSYLTEHIWHNRTNSYSLCSTAWQDDGREWLVVSFFSAEDMAGVPLAMFRKGGFEQVLIGSGALVQHHPRTPRHHGHSRAEGGGIIDSRASHGRRSNLFCGQLDRVGVGWAVGAGP